MRKVVIKNARNTRSINVSGVELKGVSIGRDIRKLDPKLIVEKKAENVCVGKISVEDKVVDDKVVEEAVVKEEAVEPVVVKEEVVDNEEVIEPVIVKEQHISEKLTVETAVEQTEVKEQTIEPVAGQPTTDQPPKQKQPKALLSRYVRYIKPRDEIIKLATNESLSLPRLKHPKSPIALIFCNSYHNTSMDLGDCAINDGILAYDWFNNLSYNTFIYYDALSVNAIRLIKQALSMKTETNRLAIYFIGHGTRIRDNNRDEEDGYDEMFVFKDKYLRDDEMCTLLTQFNPNKKDLVLMSDCCHSGTIFDLDAKKYEGLNVVSITACHDAQTAKQDWIERKGNGIFSHYYWRYIDENKSSEEIVDRVNVKAKLYQQQSVVHRMGKTIEPWYTSFERISV